MELTLTYDYLREEEVELIRAFNELGVKVNAVQSSKPLHIGDVNGPCLVRNLNHRNAITIAGIIEASGGLSINKYLTLNITWNKAITTALLKRHGLPVPDTFVVFDSEVDGIFDSGRIVKPASGSWGRLTAMVNNSEYRLLFKHARDHMPLLVQERIGDGTDLRVFVINGSVVASMIRRPPSGEWRSNVARGGLPMPIKVNGEVEEYAIKAAEAVGAFYAGVDILVNGDGYFISEVNGIPEFKAISKVNGLRVGLRLAEAVVKWIKS